MDYFDWKVIKAHLEFNKKSEGKYQMTLMTYLNKNHCNTVVLKSGL